MQMKRSIKESGSTIRHHHYQSFRDRTREATEIGSIPGNPQPMGMADSGLGLGLGPGGGADPALRGTRAYAPASGGRGRMGGPYAAGPGGTCVCPSCGHTESHDTGTSCEDRTCPKCGAKMTRMAESLVKRVLAGESPKMIVESLLNEARYTHRIEYDASGEWIVSRADDPDDVIDQSHYAVRLAPRKQSFYGAYHQDKDAVAAAKEAAADYAMSRG